MEPELRRILTPEQCAAAQRFLLPTTTVDKDGNLEAPVEDSHAFGALVLDGLLGQTVQIGTHETLQLIGPGALVPLERAVDPVPITRSRLCPGFSQDKPKTGNSRGVSAGLMPRR